MTNTLLSSFSDVFISTLAFLSHIFHFGCHVHHVRMTIIGPTMLGPATNFQNISSQMAKKRNSEFGFCCIKIDITLYVLLLLLLKRLAYMLLERGCTFLRL